MQSSSEIILKYTHMLHSELIPSFGCTEPVSLAFCAAKATHLLDAKPEEVSVIVSGNVLKNAKSVVIPNTNGLKGIAAAVATGIIAGDSNKKLEVISTITSSQQRSIVEFLKNTNIQIDTIDSDSKLVIEVSVRSGNQSASVKISEYHTNIVSMSKNNQSIELTELPFNRCPQGTKPYYEKMSVEEIIEYANTADLSSIKELLDRQIEYNIAIAEEGLRHPWGANIGRTILMQSPDNLKAQAKAYAASASDARMSGCELPVIINSGSGNQGITVSLPVILFAKGLNVNDDTLYRALIVSNLIAIHIKSGIGPLSAYCGAVSAGSAAGCGIAYLYGGRYEAVSHTLVNAIAITSGMICDGAKPSCAAKIAASVDAGILGYEMYQNGNQFYGGDGIVEKGVENTIHNIQRLSIDGMNATDKEIIRIMSHING